MWRRRWYLAGRQHHLRQPVISVGNLSHGGRGKTPLVGLLARWLVEEGERPAVLTRGYARARREDGVVVVSDGQHLLADLDRSGDEPLMLARAVPRARVLVSEQRALAGALAERVLGATVHLLDDGFQHVQLARDIDIVIVSPDDLNDRPIPFGRLRESVAALSFADAVIVDGKLYPGPQGPGLHQNKSRARRVSWSPEPLGSGYTLERSLGDPLPLEPHRPWSSPEKRVVAVAGIARPERFRESLEKHGWTIVEMLTFPDHHRYSWSDVARISAIAAQAKAPVLTTEKDAVRLLPLRPLPPPVAYAPLSVSIQPPAFRSWLLDRLASCRRTTRRASA